MPRHRYLKLTAHCRETRYYGPADLRIAVDYLKSIVSEPDTPFMRIGIEAQTVVPAARLHLRARPFIALDDITGKTPREVWQSFDNQVDRQIDSLVRFQSHGFRP